MSAHGRPEALTPERNSAKVSLFHAHGRPEALTPQRDSAKVALVHAHGRPEAPTPERKSAKVALGRAHGSSAAFAPQHRDTALGRLLVQAFLLVLLAALAPATLAGRPCEEQPLQVRDLERGMQLAQNVRRRLDDSGAQVVVIARAGQDLSAYGLRWSHLGLAYREGDGEKGYWRIVHKLNHCNTPNAALYRQGLGQFFLDRPFRYEAAYVVLSAPAQVALLAVLRDNAASSRLHEPRYNMLAYPWADKYQQSNQWALETLAGAMDPDARTRRQAQAWLQLRGYEPTALRIGPLTRLGANVTRANIAFDDHPNSKRFADRIETVTVDSVFDWLARSGLSEGPVQRVGL